MPDEKLARRVSTAAEARRPDAERLLGDLVRIPSVTGNEGAVQRRIEREMLARNLTVDRWEATPEEIAPYIEHVGEQARHKARPNLLGVRTGVGGGRSILLNAHIDTVEAGDAATWSRDPFSGAASGGFVQGRGSCDMKGGLVTFLLALDVLDDLGLRLAGDVLVNSVVGEEDGGLGALSTVLRGHRADAVLISEPTRLACVVAQGGSVMFRLAVPGRSTHAAVRNEGVSAFEAFLPLYDALLDLEEERNAALSHLLYDHLTDKVPINVGVVRAGNWASTVPESLTAEVRAGLIPGETLDDFKRTLEERLRSVCETDDWLAENPPELRYLGGQFAPSEISSKADISAAVLRAHRAVTGKDAPVEGVAYGSDMRHFVNTGGMPCVMYGAGDLADAHAPDEKIRTEDLLTAAKTCALLLVDWCGPPNR
ncbi:ArgE/DapE family deacylase [Rubrobacter indicoceani]|uniref:ArgE/DapE family deacylase n=1 Tax=Rubrobacter indicoceani TaxID=2051957 RepID=UPI000E5A4282|nr:ArgE/DapE family deacylase [Rubrobacter indicoceani]